jgi:hypothetical protein
LLADIQDSPGGVGNKVAEVVYDASIGLWGYLHLRKDKIEPNYIDTVIGVFMEQVYIFIYIYRCVYICMNVYLYMKISVHGYNNLSKITCKYIYLLIHTYIRRRKVSV